MHTMANSPSVLAALRKQQPSEADGNFVQGVLKRANGGNQATKVTRLITVESTDVYCRSEESGCCFMYTDEKP